MTGERNERISDQLRAYREDKSPPIEFDMF